MGTTLRFVALAAAVAALAATSLLTTLSGSSPGRPLAPVKSAFTVDGGFGHSGATLSPGSNGGTGVAVVPSGVADAGSIMVSGSDNTHFQVARFTSSGALDHSFGGGITNLLSGGANAVTVIPAGLAGAGDVVAVGYSSNGACGSNPTPIVAEYLPTGTLNASFGASGVAALACPTTGARLNAVAIDPAGNIDVAGQSFGAAGATSVLVAAFPPSGASGLWSLTTAAGGTGAGANAVTYDSATGDVVAAGWKTDASGQHLLVAAINNEAATGNPGSVTLDTAGFGSPNGFVTTGPAGASASGMVVLNNGNIVTGGSTNITNGQLLLAAFSQTGTPAAGFGSEGLVTNSPSLGGGAGFSGLAFQPLDNLLSAAGFAGNGTAEKVVISQYNATTGAVNTSFGVNGVIKQSFGSAAIPSASSLGAVAVQSDGKAVAAGTGPVINDIDGMLLMRAFGPVVSVGNPALVKWSSTKPVTLHFPASLSEPMPVAVLANFCATGNVNGQGSCGTVNVPAGHTTFTVPVTVPINVPIGHAEIVKLTVKSGNGLAADPSHSVGVGQIQLFALPPPYKGYWMVASDGGIFTFGTTRFFGSTGAVHLHQPIVGMSVTPKGDGYWLVASDGGIFAFGKARFFGSTGAVHLHQPIVSMASTPDGKGYWLVASDGGIFAFGDARFFGSTGAVHLARPIVGMASTPDGKGYWLVASDGGIFAFGDAGFFGSTGAVHLTKPIVGMAAYPGAGGYWLVASDGGIFSFGAAGFHGSTGAVRLTKPIVGMAANYDGAGYWLVASDGGIFAFGTSHFFGSTGNVHLTKPIVGMHA